MGRRTATPVCGRCVLVGGKGGWGPRRGTPPSLRTSPTALLAGPSLPNHPLHWEKGTPPSSIGGRWGEGGGGGGKGRLVPSSQPVDGGTPTPLSPSPAALGKAPGAGDDDDGVGGEAGFPRRRPRELRAPVHAVLHLHLRRGGGAMNETQLRDMCR